MEEGDVVDDAADISGFELHSLDSNVEEMDNPISTWMMEPRDSFSDDERKQ